MAQVQILYIATARGLNQFANPGTSDRWRAVGHALSNQDVPAVRASMTDPLRAFAGSAEGLSTTTNGGATWEVVLPAPVSTLAAMSGAVYAGLGDGTVVRESGGTWVSVHDGLPVVTHLAVLSDEQVVAICEDGSIGIVEGRTINPSGERVPGALSVVSSAAHPDDVFVISRAGVHAAARLRVLEHSLTGAAVFLAGKPEVLLLGSDQSILRSEDNGATFAPVKGPAGVRVLVSPPRYQDYAYAGTASGELWLSRDRGRNWQLLNSGLAPIRDLSFARVF
jgi:hypothetical protein